MDITLQPSKLAGTVTAPSSKSMAHRLMICAAFAHGPTVLHCPDTNQDIEATAECLRALGADIRRTETQYIVTPAASIPPQARMNCRESASTLRFLLPVIGALGVEATIVMEGRLSQRPLSPLWEEMERMGCTLSRPAADVIYCKGKLRSGAYCIDGGISSQFISGLLLALPLIDGQTSLKITDKVESRPYIEMTMQAISLFASGCPERIEVEGDWSSAAFWLAANALGSEIAVTGLNEKSTQGDRAITRLLPALEKNCTISAADIPDLVPILSVVAAANRGAVFTDIGRLRLKESDRVASIIAMLESLGGKAEATQSTLTVYGTGLNGGIAESCNDHRIAMAAAIAATICKEPVTVLDAECVKKSYPKFWEEYGRLGGNYEQYLR